MRSRAFRPIATILSLLLMAAVPVHASPLTFADVVHVMGNMQNGGQNPQLRLRTVQQQGTTPTNGTTTAKAATQTNSSNAQTPGGSNNTTTTTSGTEPSSLIQGAQTPTTQTPKVEVVQQGDIEGTICDCGEVRLPAGHFPWWWLAGIPAVCLTGICTKDKPKCEGPNCTQCIPKAGEDANCQTTTIPEPASLLLLGSGLAALGAGARRRYHRIKLVKQESVATEV